MSAAPWFRFYPSDWRADPALRMCSVAARGLWMELLCVMHEATPRGYLFVKGKKVTDRQIATLVGVTEEEVVALLAELESVDVFSRDEDGVVFSRKMVRDTEKAIKDKEYGKGGGNPRLKGRVNPKDNGKDKPNDKAHGNGSGSKETPTSQEEASTREADAGRPANPIDLDAEFSDVFWPAYPSRVAQVAAEEAWPDARAVASLEEIMAGLERYKRSRPPDRQWMNPDNWLVNRRWKDDAVKPGKATPSRPTVWITDEDNRWPQAVERWRSEKGKPPVRVAGIGGLGCHFPADWFDQEKAA